MKKRTSHTDLAKEAKYWGTVSAAPKNWKSVPSMIRGINKINKMNKIVIIGGGTFSYVRNHLALAAPAFGRTAGDIFDRILEREEEFETDMYLTKMAGGFHSSYNYASDSVDTGLDSQSPNLVTNEDVSNLVDQLVADPQVKIIFFNAALCDYNGVVGDEESEKYAPRLKTREQNKVTINCTPADKIIGKIRKDRKDIFLVGFKTTTGATEDEQYLQGMRLLKGSSCNLVLANDTVERRNMILTPEEARYHVTKDRDEALSNLVDMTMLRSKLNFTRTTMVEGALVPLDSFLIPSTFKTVVEYCLENNAYKPFRGKTVGHYGYKSNDSEYFTSRRKNNHVTSPDMILVKIPNDDTIIACGKIGEESWKPSAGTQTQRRIFNDHPEYDCVIHFHCPLKEDSEVPVAPQRAFECGSAECGINTSKGLRKFGNLSAVYLDQHGPNVLFSSHRDPKEVIKFIEENFDLSEKTGGILKDS